jgi:hypothetical protein
LNKKWLKVWSSIIGVAVIVALVLALVPAEVTVTGKGLLSIGLRQVSANPDWLSGYDYRKQITIDGTTEGAQTNYWKKLTIVADQDTFPSQTVGTSTSPWGTADPFQDKLFYIHDLFWLFWNDGSNLVLQTSSDNGVTWSSKTTIISGDYQAYMFMAFYDGTYLHYARVMAASGTALYYRRGTPNTNGSITWSAAEQIVVSAEAGYCLLYENIIVDSSGYPWIGYTRVQDPWSSYDNTLYVTKSSTSDGTWATASGFPYTLTTITKNTFVGVAQGAALTNGRVYWAYPKSNPYYIYGRLYNSGWGDEESLASVAVYNNYNIVEDGDHVHLIHVDGRDIWYRKRTYGTGWGTATQIEGASRSSIISMTLGGTDNPIALWAGYSGGANDHHYYYAAKSDSWAVVDWLNETTDSLTGTEHFVALRHGTGLAKAAIAYSTKTSSPYNVKFAFLAQSYKDICVMDGHCQADFDDIRFTQSDGSTELDYWIPPDSIVSGDTCDVYIEFNSIPADPDSGTFYIYYDKADATSGSDIDAAFLFGDDFLAALDGAKWTTVAGEIATNAGNLEIIGTTGTRGNIQGKTDIPMGARVIVRAKWSDVGQSNNRFLALIGVDQATADIDVAGHSDDNELKLVTWHDSSYTQTLDLAVSDVTNYHLYTLLWKANSVKLFQDTTLLAEHTTNVPNDDMKAWFYEASTAVGTAYVDWIIIGKYVDPEPTWGAWGSEEGCSPDISNTPSVNDFGILQVNTTGNTAINYFTIENTGNCAVDVTIQGTDVTGGDDTWDLADNGSPSENIYSLYAGLDDVDDLFDIVVRETATYNTLVSDLIEDATQDWGLKFYMPTSVTNYDGQVMTGTITLIVSAS